MCLTSEGNFNYASLFYSNCSDDDLNQVFIFKRLKSDHLLSFGILFSSNEDLCVEMNNGNLLMYSSCQDTVEILDNGALKHVEDGTCFGFDATESTVVTVVDCNSETVETWIASDFSPPVCNIEDFTGYSLLGSGNKHCYRLQLGTINSSFFEQDADNKDCVDPFVSQYRVGELESISDEGAGFYTAGDSSRCPNGISRSGTLKIFQSSNVEGIEVAVDGSGCKYEATIMVAKCETVAGDWFSFETSNLCADLEDWTTSKNGMKVRLATCKPAAWSQHWRYDDSGRLVNRYNNKCLEAGDAGNLYAKAFVTDCKEETHQGWSIIEGKYLNKAYEDSKYLGVAYCGDTSNDKKWLELRNLHDDAGICNETQTWHQTIIENDAQSWSEVSILLTFLSITKFVGSTRH